MRNWFPLTLAILVGSLLPIGCADDANSPGDAAEVHSPDDGHEHGTDEHAGHDHADEDHAAPHGGHLIELGRSHEYHAELVDDHQAETVTIYLLDSHIEPMTASQESVSLSLTVGDRTQTFELAADGDAFASRDAELMAMIDAEGARGKLRVTIDGKPYSGTFDHHDHGSDEDGHDH